MKKTVILPLFVLTLVVSGCFFTNSTKEKELELKEREIAIKEKELERSKDKEKEDGENGEYEEAETTDEPKIEVEEKEEIASNRGKVYTPKRGSAERKAIFNALRVPVEKQLKQSIVFAPSNFKVYNGWAFVGGEPLTRSGKKPDYKGTIYQQDVEADMFDNNFFALLRKTGGRWKVVKYYIGCTDVCYLGWDKEYNAPKEIFP